MGNLSSGCVSGYTGAELGPLCTGREFVLHPQVSSLTRLSSNGNSLHLPTAADCIFGLLLSLSPPVCFRCRSGQGTRRPLRANQTSILLSTYSACGQSLPRPQSSREQVGRWLLFFHFNHRRTSPYPMDLRLRFSISLARRSLRG